MHSIPRDVLLPALLLASIAASAHTVFGFNIGEPELNLRLDDDLGHGVDPIRVVRAAAGLQVSRSQAHSDSSSGFGNSNGCGFNSEVSVNGVKFQFGNDEQGQCRLKTGSFCLPPDPEKTDPTTDEDEMFQCHSGSSCLYHNNGGECTYEKMDKELSTKFLHRSSRQTEKGMEEVLMQMFRDGVCTCG